MSAKKTTSTRTTTSKTTKSTKTAAKATPRATPSATTAKAAKTAKTPDMSVVTEAKSTEGVNELKKRELMDLVLQRADVKKKYAKPVIEAVIDVLGEALAQERPLNLQPMGRVLPQRSKDDGKNRVIITRIRQSKKRIEEAAAEKEAKPAVAEGAE